MPKASNGTTAASLHVDRLGRGPELVLLHGWGLHGGVFADLVERLAAHATLTIVDLPGHGHSGYVPGDLGMPALCARLAGLVQAPALWFGWSLGGLIAVTLASRHPAAVRGLLLAATTPRFTQTADWSPAMAEDVFAGFARDLDARYDATLQRFLALQTRGATDASDTLRRLRETLRARPTPQAAALRDGLKLLAGEDRRADLATIPMPTLCLAGERDTLAPLAAMQTLAQALPNARLQTFAGAGHAPFLSHAEAFAAAIIDFTTAHV